MSGNIAPGSYRFDVWKRARGVYLASWWCTDGKGNFEAFSTAAAAKRWCASVVGRERLSFRSQGSGWWAASVEVRVEGAVS
jgi:hypothetical protein